MNERFRNATVTIKKDESYERTSVHVQIENDDDYMNTSGFFDYSSPKKDYTYEVLSEEEYKKLHRIIHLHTAGIINTLLICLLLPFIYMDIPPQINLDFLINEYLPKLLITGGLTYIVIIPVIHLIASQLKLAYRQKKWYFIPVSIVLMGLVTLALVKIL